MNISLIVACGRNALIGVPGGLPWHLSADLQNFKQITLNKTIVMGRKTWSSLPLQPLPDRRNIVLSRSVSFTALGAEVVHSAADLSKVLDERECIVIGGAQIYQYFLPMAQKIYLTLVAAEPAGDVYFPELDMREWRELNRRHHTSDEKNEFDMDFIVLQKKADSCQAALTGDAKPFFVAAI